MFPHIINISLDIASISYNIPSKQIRLLWSSFKNGPRADSLRSPDPSMAIGFDWIADIVNFFKNRIVLTIMSFQSKQFCALLALTKFG